MNAAEPPSSGGVSVLHEVRRAGNNVLMKRLSVTVSVLCAGLMLSACGGEAGSVSNAAGSPGPISREAGRSVTIPFAVENQLNDWWGGPGISITWRVSETVNYDWDGISRPDHVPPNGFQGLVQKNGSGSFRVPLEINDQPGEGPSSRFVLTPVISIDGQEIELQPISAKLGTFLGVRLSTSGSECFAADINGSPPPTVVSLSARTPRGLLVYDVVLKCRNPLDYATQHIMIRNYQKS